MQKCSIMVWWLCFSKDLGCGFFSEIITFSQNISFAFVLYFSVENGVIRKHNLSLLEFCNSKIAIQIVCSCKSNTLILMAGEASSIHPVCNKLMNIPAPHSSLRLLITLKHWCLYMNSFFNYHCQFWFSRWRQPPCSIAGIIYHLSWWRESLGILLCSKLCFDLKAFYPRCSKTKHHLLWSLTDYIKYNLCTLPSCLT